MNGTLQVVLEAHGISKSFPGVKALEEVNLTLRRGRLTALLGENGAGKSTLMNILAGVFPPDIGTIRLHGREVRFANTRAAQDAGIAMIFQELNLIPNLTIAENLFLGREPRTRVGFLASTVMNRNAATLLERLDLRVPPTISAGSLRVGQQQVVEIARALSCDARVIIMDEPTSALSDREITVLFERIAGLKRDGVAVVYITHKLDEVERIGDDAVVLRDGRVVGAAPVADLSHDEIVRMMVGRDRIDLYQKTSGPAEPEVLRVEGITLPHPDRPGDFLVHKVSFQVRRGEVLGIFGLMGAGRTELLETLFGLHADCASGEIFIGGQRAAIRSPADAIRHGLALAPEDRKREGIILEMTVAANTSLASLHRIERFGMLMNRAEYELVTQALQRFRVKTPSIQQLIRNLSGGNQQKVILAKWLATKPVVLLLDEPTRGIDVHAKKEIYTLIDELARGGLAVVLVSSELTEILALSDRIMVLSEGRKTMEVERELASEEALMKAALPTHSKTTKPLTQND
jgi:ABC-type sugar transport system ATPase subunit